MPAELAAAFSLLDVRGPPRTTLAAAELVRKGFPFKSLEALSRRADLPLDRVQQVLAIPPRTLARRKVDDHFTAEESEHLLRFARVIAYGIEVLGTRDAMAAWLETPNRTLGHRAPISLLDTALGAEAVTDVLGRIDHGVIS